MGVLQWKQDVKILQTQETKKIQGVMDKWNEMISYMGLLFLELMLWKISQESYNNSSGTLPICEWLMLIDLWPPSLSAVNGACASSSTFTWLTRLEAVLFEDVKAQPWRPLLAVARVILFWQHSLQWSKGRDSVCFAGTSHHCSSNPKVKIFKSKMTFRNKP